MTKYSDKATAIKNALDARYENKVSNKKTSLEGDYSSDTTSYPTVQAVKSGLSGKLDSAQGSGNANKNVVTNSSGNITFEAKPTIPTKTSDLTNDSGFVTSSDFPTLATVATSGSYNDLSNKPTLSTLGGVVTVEKQTTAESSGFATYHVKQNGTKVGDSINIPKDFLVKSGSLKTAGSTASSAETAAGVNANEKYISLIINTKDSTTSSGDTELIIPVNDLVDTYTADNTTITLSNNQFAVKAGGIGTTQLASGVVTSLGYADAYNSSAAKNITSSDITAWNGKSNITTSDVDTEIEAYLDALISAYS